VCTVLQTCHQRQLLLVPVDVDVAVAVYGCANFFISCQRIFSELSTEQDFWCHVAASSGRTGACTFSAGELEKYNCVLFLDI